MMMRNLGFAIAALMALGCDDPQRSTPPVDAGDAQVDAREFDLGRIDSGSGCIPQPEVCNGVDDDCDGRVDDEDDEVQRANLSDPNNCGACGVICEAPNAELTCQGGVCYIVSCAPGFGDYNATVADGCETDCLITNGGVEQCDGQDNDCDGEIDEGFDLQTDLAHCGGCDQACPSYNFGDVTCVAGVCENTCQPGHYDLNGDPSDGCEYRCDVLASDDIREYCNGIDDDCDGLIDEPEDRVDPMEGCGELGVCGPQCEADEDCVGSDLCAAGVCVAADGGPAGQPCAVDADCQAIHPGYGCVGEASLVAGRVEIQRRCQRRTLTPTCDAELGYRCVRAPTWHFGNEVDRCDGLDNDCDGRADEDFVEALRTDDRREARPCAVGQGVCQRQGLAQCAPDGRGVICDAVPGEPLGADDQCDGVDDDCDGLVDEDYLDPMVAYPGFAIFAYEASRPGATAEVAGYDATPDDDLSALVEIRACSRANTVPWTDVSFEDAAAACAAAGYRLCTAEEWQLSCGGPQEEAFPYGNFFDVFVCNGGGFDADPTEPGIQDALRPTGSLAPCERGGVYDLSGNAKEWVDAPQEGLVQVRGGGYQTNLPQGLTCQQDEDLKAPEFRHRALGFRCCVDR